MENKDFFNHLVDDLQKEIAQMLDAAQAQHFYTSVSKYLNDLQTNDPRIVVLHTNQQPLTAKLQILDVDSSVTTLPDLRAYKDLWAIRIRSHTLTAFPDLPKNVRLLDITALKTLSIDHHNVPFDTESAIGQEIIKKLAAMQTSGRGFLLKADPAIKNAVDAQAQRNVQSLGYDI